MITDKLGAVQKALKAPKTQKNSFGGYNYRSCEDILEAVKPILAANGLTLTLTDEIVMVGTRIYVKATATIYGDKESLSVSAYAREEEIKKGMDASQVTGAASSYARKYALNGLFCIDDTKDSDATNTHGKETIACESCGSPIVPYIGKNGKKIQPTDHAVACRSKFGKVLCLSCIQGEGK